MEIIVFQCHILIFVYKVLQPVLHIFELLSILTLFPILNAISFGGLYRDRPLCESINSDSTFGEFECSDIIYWVQRVLIEDNYQPQCGLNWSPPHYMYCKIECSSFYSTSPCFWQTTREILEIIIINAIIILYLSGACSDMIIKWIRNCDTPGLY